jgi:protein O-mannosyl-transferase
MKNRTDDGGMPARPACSGASSSPGSVDARRRLREHPRAMIRRQATSDVRRSLAATALPAGVALAVVVAFLPVLGHGFVLWDDDLNLTDNPSYRGLSPRHLAWMFTTLHAGHYQPLAWMTLGLDFTLWGLRPAGYHLTNLALHVANALLVYALAIRLLRPAGAAAAPPRTAAAVGALLFAVHPLRVEPVAWISERRDVLSAGFYLATLLAYLRAREGGGGRWDRVAFGCFLASLLSKAWAMTLPAVLLLLDWYPLRRVRDRATAAAAVREKVPYLVPALVAAGVAAVAVSRVPEIRTLEAHGPLARLAQAAWGLCFYLWKTLVPLRLSPLYLLDEPLDPFAPPYIAAAAAIVVAAVAVFALRRRVPALLAASAAYVIVVSPVLGLLQAGPQMAADRYTYLACVPWALLAAALLEHVRRPAVWGAAFGIVVVLGALAFRQTFVWRDSVTLWSHALAVDARNHVAYTNRGWAHQQAGALDAAIADYGRALGVRPSYVPALFNRGTARDAVGDHDGAIADYTLMMRVAPGDLRAQANRGFARRAKGDAAGALADYATVLATAPADWPHRPMVEQALGETRASVR